MIYKSFAASLAYRLIFIGLLLTSAIWLMMNPAYYGATLLVSATFVFTVAELWFFIRRTNRDLARFFSAAKHADFTQRFNTTTLGSGFNELGDCFNSILDNMYQQQEKNEIQSRRLQTLIDHTPVPLLTLHGEKISLHNNAVRRLFGSTHVTTLEDLKKFGLDFHNAIETATPGTRKLVTFTTEGIENQLTLATTENIIENESYRLISLQDIQSELDISQEQAWRDLVRVLTHEIMNSITPVTSLAKTANDIVEDIQSKTDNNSPIKNDLEDLQAAVSTVSRRSDNLLQFVDSYRQLNRVSTPNKTKIKLSEIFQAVQQLADAEWTGSSQWLSLSVSPKDLTVNADRMLLEPVLLNLLRNAKQATEEKDKPTIKLNARLNGRGNTVIEVIDNGAGIPTELTKKIFVPFFTTRTEGSGVGLALAKQVMTAHSGFIQVDNETSGGAKFTLTF